MDTRNKQAPSGGAAVPIDPSDPNLPPKVRDVLTKGKTSWLKNPEVCDLLVNHAAFNLPISRDAPSQPPGGSIFMFDRKAVRFFRKDGHNWRKKADGKTVRETHEKLKVGNQDMLNCYYAHANQEDGLQRRCYWLLNSEDDIVLVHYLNIEKDKSNARKTENASEFERSRSKNSNFSAASSGKFIGTLGGLMPNLAGLSNDASQAFLPLSGDQPRLQPGGIEDLMTYYTQTEENAARRELQQGTTYVDNLLPSAWDNIGNEVPALDVGLPDWNAHVLFHSIQGCSGISSFTEEDVTRAPRLPNRALGLGLRPSALKSMHAPGMQASMMHNDMSDQAHLVEHAGSLRMIELGFPGEDLWTADLANAMRTPSLEMRMRSGSMELRQTLRARQASIERNAMMGIPHGNLFAGASNPRGPLGFGGHGLASGNVLGNIAQRQGPPGVPTQGLRDQQGFDQDRGMRMSQRMFPAVNGGGLHQGQAANSLQLLQQQQMRQQLENQIAQALSNAAVQQQRQQDPQALNNAAELNAVYLRQQQLQPRLGNANWVDDLIAETVSMGPTASHGPSLDDVSARLLMGPGPVVSHQFSDQSQVFPRAVSEGHPPLGPQLVAARDQVVPREITLMATKEEAQQVWRGNNAFRTGQVLAMERQLSDIDRQTMEVLMTSRSKNLHSQGSSSQVLDSKVKTLEDKLERLEAGSHMILSSAVPVQPVESAGQRSMTVAPASGGVEVNQQGSPGDTIESAREDDRANSQITGPEGNVLSCNMTSSTFNLVDFTPNWDYTVGGAKMIITFRSSGAGFADRPLVVMFDDNQVPGTVICQGAIRCHVPPHEAGTVKFYVTTEDGVHLCKPQPFTYRLTPDAPRVADAMTVISQPDRELQLRLVNMLLGATSNSDSSANFQATQYSSEGSKQHQNASSRSACSSAEHPVIMDTKGNLTALDVNELERLLLLLLQQKLRSVACLPDPNGHSIIREGFGHLPDVLNQLSPGGVGLIHFSAALGYDWAVSILLQGGAKIQLKDAWGRAALHWAAQRGHERTVALLIVRDAIVDAKSFPTMKHAGKTAADLAAESGHFGIAAFLAELTVMQKLDKDDQESCHGINPGSEAENHEEGTRRPGSAPHRRKRTRAPLPTDMETEWESPSHPPTSAVSVESNQEPGSVFTRGHATAGDAAKIVARVRCALEFLMQSIARQTAHKVRLEERRQRLAQREGEALSRIGESLKVWNDVQHIAKEELDRNESGDALLRRFITLGERITRLNRTFKGALTRAQQGLAGSDIDESEEGWRAERDRGEIADYGSDSDVQMIRCDSFASARRLQQLHNSRRKNSLTGIKGMGVSDQELRAFLKCGGSSSSSNPANVSSKQLRKQLQDDGLRQPVRPPASTQSAPLPNDLEKLQGASVLSELQALLQHVEALFSNPAAFKQYMRVERYVEEWRLQPLSRKFARKGSSNACNVAWAD